MKWIWWTALAFGPPIALVLMFELGYNSGSRTPCSDLMDFQIVPEHRQ